LPRRILEGCRGPLVGRRQEMGCAEAGEDRQNESPSLTVYLSQAGTAESFKIVLLVGVLLDRHLACDPGEAKPAVVKGDPPGCSRKQGQGLAFALEPHSTG
jgi:hypothetical protein